MKNIVDFSYMRIEQGTKVPFFDCVDAYNNEKTIRFYSKNGFEFLTGKDVNQKTRLMFFDLAAFNQ